MSKIILIKNFPNRIFAEQAREILERNEISAVLKSADVGILGTASSSLNIGVNLYVEEEEAERAAELIDALYDGI